MQPQPNAAMEEKQEADTPGLTGADDDGNITSGELATFFGTEPSEPTEDVPIETEVVEPEDAPAGSEDSETTEESTEDVLSHSEEEAGEDEADEAEEPEVPKSTQKLLKQISKLTARAKGAEEKVDDMRKEVDALKSESPEDQAVKGGSTGIPEIDKVETVGELDALREQAMLAKRFALKHIGKDYVEDGEEEYDGDQIRNILRRSEDFLMEHIPARQAYLQEREHAEGNAREDFPVWRGEDDEGEQLVMNIMGNADLMNKSLSQMPNQKYLVGLMYEGMKVVQARKAEAGKKPPAKKRAASPPSATEEVSASPQSQTRSSKKERKKYEALGSENVSAQQLTKFFTD